MPEHVHDLVSIHPYFKPHAGCWPAFQALLPRFVERTVGESANVYYEFTFDGETVHCREGYVGADGLLTHLRNVGDLVDEALKISDLVRVEVHGPATELTKLRKSLEGLKPAWFEIQAGVRR